MHCGYKSETQDVMGMHCGYKSETQDAMGLQKQKCNMQCAGYSTCIEDTQTETQHAMGSTSCINPFDLGLSSIVYI